MMIAQPIRSLQFMLGELARRYSVLPFVAEDGVFGENTLEAVMVFQREFCPPVTGEVDQHTWDAISERYRAMVWAQSRPRQLCCFPGGDFRVVPGETTDTMALIQIMYKSLSGVLCHFSQDSTDGVCGKQSVENTKWLQHCCQLEENGVMDRFSWDMLSRLYSLFIVRRQEQGQNLKNCTK